MQQVVGRIFARFETGSFDRAVDRDQIAATRATHALKSRCTGAVWGKRLPPPKDPHANPAVIRFPLMFCPMCSAQILDVLTLLVDKSLVVADDSGGRTCCRLLETVLA